MTWWDSDTLAEIAPPPMQQHATYGRACAAMGSRLIRLATGPSHAPHGTVHVLVRRWPGFGAFGLVARGPVWAPQITADRALTLSQDLVAHLRLRLRGVIATPELVAGTDPLARSGRLRMMSPGSLARLSLEGTEAARLARQAGKWRNRLRVAQGSGLEVRHAPLPPNPGHWLLRREAAQARSRRYRRLPTAFAAHWAAVNGRGSTRLFTAHRGGGAPLAAMLFLRHGAAASYHIGWSGDEGRALSAHNLLLWEAATWFADEGTVWIDLGTLDTERTPGLARFKLGAGAEPVTLGATWIDAPGTALVARLTGQGALGGLARPGAAVT